MHVLTGTTAVVTGAAGGIGEAVVRSLQSHGITVLGVDRNSSTADFDFKGDLTDAKFCDAVISEAVDRLGHVDYLINNAGVITRGTITEATEEDYATTMAVNVEAPYRLCRAVIPVMAAAGGGAIVNTSSCWGLRPGPSHPIYVMSKAAIASLTQCLGRDHAHQNIRVNAVCPNEVNTPMLRSGFIMRGLDPKDGVAELDATVPIGHVAEPEEIADVITFLLSDGARYMCGALLEVNGGKPVV